MKFFPLSVVPFSQLLDEVGLTGRRSECRDEILVCADVVDDRPRRDHAGPTDQAGNTECAFKIRRLLAPKGRGAAVGPCKSFGAIVGGVDYDGVVGDTEVIDQLQQLPDVSISLHHAVRIDADSCLAL